MNIESVLMLYIFPLQFAVGIVGNFLNLVVLLNRRMRSKTNILLAMVALADIHFLIFMLPHALMFNSYLTKNPTFRTLILHGINHITGIINACAFASAWLIVVVSIERMMAVTWPLKSRCIWTWHNLKIIIVATWIVGFLVSIHFHITHNVSMVVRNETILNLTTGTVEHIERRALQQAIRPSMKRFWRIATLLNVFFVVLAPVVIVIGANGLMISQLLLRKDKRRFASHIQNHRRATFTVFVIASTFTVCQTPSAIIFICEILWPDIGLYSQFRTAATLSNSLVVTGKTANHFLFCLWSSHFRKNLCLIVSSYLPTIVAESIRRKLSYLNRNNRFSSLFGLFQPHAPIKREHSILVKLNSNGPYATENGGTIAIKKPVKMSYSVQLLSEGDKSSLCSTCRTPKS